MINIDFDTAGGSITSIDDSIRELEEVKKHLDSNTLVIDENASANVFSGMLVEIDSILQGMLDIRNELSQLSLNMKNVYDSFTNANK